MKTDLLEFGWSMPLESSALIPLVEHTWIDEFERILAEHSAAVVRDAVRADLLEQLEAGGNIAFTFSGVDTLRAGISAVLSADGGASFSGYSAPRMASPSRKLSWPRNHCVCRRPPPISHHR